MSGHSMFFTAGIGDYIALEWFFSDDDRTRTEICWLALAYHRQIAELIGQSGFSRNPKIELAYTDFEGRNAMFSLAECIKTRRDQNLPELPGLAKAADWSIVGCFRQISAGIREHVRSVLLDHQLADVSRFNLPQPYVLISPYSADKRNPARDYTMDDWRATIAWLVSRNLQGVVVYGGQTEIPHSDRLLDLTGQTTILEAVELVRQARWYVGIDSWPALVAARMLPASRLAVKAVNGWFYKWKKIYLAPHTDFKFVGRRTSDVIGLVD